MKKLSLFFILLFIVGSVLVSCGDTPCTHTDANNDRLCDLCGESFTPPHTEHTDADANGKCDECGEAVPLPDLVLIEDKIASFKFVVASGVSSSSRNKLNGYLSALSDFDIIIKAADDKEDNISEYEVLIGDVLTRGEEYRIDKYTLGNEGYVVKRIGNKIVIMAGSDDAMPYAIDAFFNDILGFYEDSDEAPENATYGEDIVEIQDNYNITALKVDGIDIRDYKIGVNSQNSDHRTAAKTLQEVLYTYTGYYLPIVSPEEATDKSIIFTVGERDGSAGFSVKSNGRGALYISSAYDSKLLVAIDDFLLNEIKIGEGEINFDSSYEYEYYTSIITYEEYGAKGDGKTNDAAAIKAAHLAANAGGQTVVAKDGATYYVGALTDAIPIRTNVNWGGASFKNASNTKSYIFNVQSEYKTVTLSESEITKVFGDTKIDKDNITKLNWSDYGYAAIIIPTNNNKRHYIRYGGNADKGKRQTEVIRVDENGNISKDTPFMFDFDTISSVEVIRISESTLTIEGGTFTSGATITRGMLIERSNTQLKNVKHYIESQDSITKASPSNGFYQINYADSVIMENCVLTARRYFTDGTYDISMNLSNNVMLIGCTQSNFYLADGKTPSMKDNKYWGVMGTNGCKNITLDSCTLSRFDAHRGVYNATIINSTLNAIEIIGGGNLLVEDSTLILVRTGFIELRDDYGSTFKGDITIRNCTAVPKSQPTTYSMIRMSWVNHNFGYTCYLPNVTIDNFTVEGLEEEGKVRIFFSNTNSTGIKKEGIGDDVLPDGTENKNKIVAPEFVKVISNSKNYTFTLFDVPLFENTVTEGITLE